MSRFYFPHVLLIPATPEEIFLSPFGLHPRWWEVSIFDLYSLVAKKHPIKMTTELIQIFLPKFNREFSIDAENYR